MSLKVLSRFPGGNAAAISVDASTDIPEVSFASDPCGGSEALWFHFRLTESEPDPAKQGKVRLTWTMVDNNRGPDFTTCIPVVCGPNHLWTRLKQGDESRTPDGLRQVSWLIPHPSPTVDIAFCFPFGPPDLDSLLSKSKDYWQSATIGLSQGARRMTRVFNTMGASGGTQPGILLLARQHAGETPGSWVIDGFLRHWALMKKGGYVIWAYPMAEIDGVMDGHYGRGGFPCDMNTAWGDPPARHECLVLKNDIARWKERCKPALAIDLHCPGAGEREGVYAVVNGDATDALTAEETKWSNIIKSELQAEYAAAEFRRSDRHPARPGTDFASFMRVSHGIPTLSLNIPYSLVGTNVLTQKSYREIGQRIAAAVLKRKG